MRQGEVASQGKWSGKPLGRREGTAGADPARSRVRTSWPRGAPSCFGTTGAKFLKSGSSCESRVRSAIDLSPPPNAFHGRDDKAVFGSGDIRVLLARRVCDQKPLIPAGPHCAAARGGDGSRDGTFGAPWDSRVHRRSSTTASLRVELLATPTDRPPLVLCRRRDRQPSCISLFLSYPLMMARRIGADVVVDFLVAHCV